VPDRDAKQSFAACFPNPELGNEGTRENAMEELELSARAHDRILRMARTISDLDGSADIKPSHVVEAIGYRSLDRKLWAR
jgi:magnesium chelatase family protein